MKMIALWTGAMSLFFTLSISVSVYEAGRDYLEAGAGNPAAVERSLVDLVGRMSAEASMPGRVQEPKGARIAVVNQDAAAILPIVEWIRKEGKVNKVNALISEKLGLASPTGELPTIQRGFFTDGTRSLMYTFAVVTVNGRQEALAMRRTTEEVVIWRIDMNGSVLVTVRSDGETAKVVPNNTCSTQYEQTIAFFRAVIARPAVG
jgi:hypothetical protein